MQQLIDRGQRIDPADHEALKEQCKAQTEKASALAASLAALEAQANATKEELAKLTEEKNKLAAEATSHKEQVRGAVI